MFCLPKTAWPPTSYRSMTRSEIVGGVEHRLGKPDSKESVLLSNSQTAVVVEDRQSGLVGKLLVRKGDNPDRG